MTGGFFIHVGDRRSGGRITARATALAARLEGRRPTDRLDLEWADILAFPRETGTAPPIALDAETGNWLLVAGTWFHSSGLMSGDEDRLLTMLHARPLEEVATGFEGFFVLVLGQARARMVSVVTDLSGGRHCYWRELGEGLAVSTSAALLGSLEETPLDPVAVTEFLSTGIIFEDRSLWSGVRKVGPAQIAAFGAAGARQPTTYWSMASIRPETHDVHAGADAIAGALADAARRIGRRFPRVLCDLTGGYDSRAAIMGFVMAGVPFAATVSGPSESADVVVSRRIARSLGVSHLHTMATWQPDAQAIDGAFGLTSGQYDLVEYARIAAIHREHAARFDVGVNGSYGELARGYWWELLFPRIGRREPMNPATVARRRLAAFPHDLSVLASDRRLDLVAHFESIVRRANAGLDGFPNTTQLDNVYLTLRMQRWQGRIGSSTDQIWPGLSPFALRSVLVPVLETRARARLASRVIRVMLARHAPTLANIPMEHGYPPLPVTAWNLHRFWPALGYYAGRVASKVRRLAHLAPVTTSRDVLGDLLRDERVHALSRFSRVAAEPWASGPGIQAFVRRGDRPPFAHHRQWCRMLTIEITLSRTADARRALEMTPPERARS